MRIVVIGVIVVVFILVILYHGEKVLRCETDHAKGLVQAGREVSIDGGEWGILCFVFLYLGIALSS